MKGLLYYFSNSGNTKLACQYLITNLKDIKFDLCSITDDNKIDISDYDLVGFACFADFLGPSKLMTDFIKKLPEQNGKFAFVFNTFGNFSGATLSTLNSIVSKKGFRVCGGFALHTPENIPNMIMAGLANTQAPNPSELDSFKVFISTLNTAIDKIKQNITPEKYSSFFIEFLMPPMPRFIANIIMGKKFVDNEKCTRCGICSNGCPYKAISIINSVVEFNEKKCAGCWFCYNHCPSKAIYTKKYKCVAHYPEPIRELKEKLK